MDTYLLANYPYNKSAMGRARTSTDTVHKRNVYINRQELKGIHGSIIFPHEVHCMRTGRIRLNGHFVSLLFIFSSNFSTYFYVSFEVRKKTRVNVVASFLS